MVGAHTDEGIDPCIETRKAPVAQPHGQPCQAALPPPPQELILLLLLRHSSPTRTSFTQTHKHAAPQRAGLPKDGPIYKSISGELSNMRWDLPFSEMPHYYGKANRCVQI